MWHCCWNIQCLWCCITRFRHSQQLVKPRSGQHLRWRPKKLSDRLTNSRPGCSRSEAGRGLKTWQQFEYTAESFKLQTFDRLHKIHILKVLWALVTGVVSLTWVEFQRPAGDARAAVTHSYNVNGVEAATGEVVEATAKASGLTAVIINMATVGHDWVLYSTLTGSPGHNSSVVSTIHHHWDVSGNTRYWR